MRGRTADMKREDVVEALHHFEEGLRPFEVERDVDGRRLDVVDHDADLGVRSQLL